MKTAILAIIFFSIAVSGFIIAKGWHTAKLYEINEQCLLSAFNDEPMSREEIDQCIDIGFSKRYFTDRTKEGNIENSTAS